MSDIYNLQVKINKDTELKLRQLADIDKRKLSNYVRVVLEDLVEGVELKALVEKKPKIEKPPLEQVVQSFVEEQSTEQEIEKPKVKIKKGLKAK